MRKILVIDDDTYICDLLVTYLSKNNYDAEAAYSGHAGLRKLNQKSFDVILSDFRLPDSDGMKILKAAKKKNPFLPVIIMTAYTDLKMAVKLIKTGAFDYVAKPVNHEEILQILKRVFTKNAESANEFKERFITGNSMAIKKVMDHIHAISPTDITILLEGETGSGKEYLARTIHYSSKRKSKPFVPVDCGAIPKELANSELFGHIKGSFTGAIRDKIGLFEQARGGTLFLDEVGNLTHDNQTKLLRALQEKVINRVGDDKNIEVDLRVIAATNDDLSKHVEEHKFREDLFHRLNGFKIQIPPLRERGDDILIFANHFLNRANLEFQKNVEGFDKDVESIFLQYDWPGNIREMENIINRCVILTNEKVITKNVIPGEIQKAKYMHAADVANGQEHKKPVLKDASHAAEKKAIINALVETQNNKSKAAKLLKIDRKTLYNKLKQFQISID